MNIEHIISACDINHRLHPVSRSAIETAQNDPTMSHLEWLRYFTLPQSINFEYADCVWNLIRFIGV